MLLKKLIQVLKLMKQLTTFCQQKISICLKHISDNLDLVLVDHLQKKQERIEKLKGKGDSQRIYQNEPDKTCFQHDMAYGDFKD